MEFFVEDDLKEELKEVETQLYKLPHRVKEYFSNIVVTEMYFMLSDLEECDSPIEQLMYLALNKQMDKILPYYTSTFVLNTQHVIKLKEKTYRADFLIATIYKGKTYEFVIECDGHDFHEKTKEQAKKDKKRDRDLTQEGYIVIRFTGSEIYENPTICAREVTNIILSHFDKG
jgi:very-short-patch-repair endonuclease